jgi:hypothetical protein
MHAAWLNDPCEKPYAQIEFAAVGVRATDPAAQLHAGILYVGLDRAVRLLHFCWDRDGRDEVPRDPYFWVQPGLRKSIARSLAALCRLVAKANALARVPWQFRYDPALVFDRGSGQRKGASGEGLTCATFVLAMFESIGVRLVDVKSWPSRPCDESWKKRIFRIANAEHVARLEPQVAAARFRPEEVTAATRVIVAGTPVRLSDVLPDARAVLSRLGASSLSCWYAPAIVAPP